MWRTTPTLVTIAFAVACRDENPAYRPTDGARADAIAVPDRPDTAAPVDGRAGDLAGDVAAPVGPDAAGLAAGLVGYWKLDDPAGSARLTDASGQGNHGVAEGLEPSAWVTGKSGTAILFDPAAANPGIRVARSGSIDGITTGVTIAAWVNGTSSVSVWRCILSRQMGTAGAEHYNLSLHGAEARMLVATSPGVEPPGNARAPVPLQRWVHVAGTYDGAVIRVYIDGREVASQPKTVTIRPDGNPVYLGTNKNGVNADETFHGMLDEVALWDRPLAAPELAALAAGSTPR